MIVLIMSGIMCGTICSLVSFFLADRLLERRGHELQAGKHEIWLFPACMVLIGIGIFCVSGFSISSVYYFALLIIGGTVSITDIHFRIIPNDMLIALLLTALCFGIPGLLGAEGFPEFSVRSSLLGLVVCFSIFMLPSALSKKVGAGDVKLAAAMGFALGLWNSLLAIVVMGVLVLMFTILQRKAPALKFVKAMIPMGPFIAVAMVLVPVLLQYSGSGGLAAAFSI